MNAKLAVIRTPTLIDRMLKISNAVFPPVLGNTKIPVGVAIAPNTFPPLSYIMSPIKKIKGPLIGLPLELKLIIA